MDYPHEHLLPGITFVRHAIARALAVKSNGDIDAADYAAKRWGARSEAVRVIKSGMLVKAGVPGGEATGDWGGLTDTEGAAREFIDAAAPLTILGKLAGLRRVPINAPYVAAAGTATAFWTGESKAIRVSPAAFNRSTMRALKVAGILVCSAETLDSPSPEAEAMVRRDLLRAIAVASDTALVDPTNAGSAGVMPAAITYGATTVASSGNLSDDLAQAIDAFEGDLSTAAWIMSPRMASRIVFTTGGLGLGAGLGLRGGELLGLPAIVSASSPSTTDGGSIALVDPTNIVTVDNGADISIVNDATVEVDTAPQGASDTPTASSANLISLFQEEAVGIRISRRINWAANPGAVVAITGADYSAP